MTRRTALFSALALACLLAACKGKIDQAPAAGRAPALAAAPLSAPKLDTWQAVGPLLAGSYSGECVHMPDMRRIAATILIGADGRASSGEITADFRRAKMVLLKRSRDNQGHHSTLVSAFVDDDKGGTLSLLSGEGNEGSSANLGRGDIMLACTKIAGAAAVNAKPLYQAVATLLDGKKQVLACSDPKDILVRKDVAVKVAGGVIRIGDASFDIAAATSETLTFADAGGTLMLNIEMADKQTIGLAYDGTGKLAVAQAWNKGEIRYACGAKA